MRAGVPDAACEIGLLDGVRSMQWRVGRSRLEVEVERALDLRRADVDVLLEIYERALPLLRHLRQLAGLRTEAPYPSRLGMVHPDRTRCRI